MFRTVLIDSIIINIRVAYAGTQLAKEDLDELLRFVYPLVVKRVVEVATASKPPGYEALLEDLRLESLTRPARVSATTSPKSAEYIAKKLRESKSRIYS